MAKVVMLASLTLWLIVGSPPSGYGQTGAAGYALRFHGNGVNDIDRVKIQIDDPNTTTPGPPADVGATDFTLEFWLKATAAENPAAAVQCGANDNWIYGNIVIDRDRYNQDRSFGLSIAGGVIVFGVRGDGTGARTICGATNVLDGQWHHIAAVFDNNDILLSVGPTGGSGCTWMAAARPRLTAPTATSLTRTTASPATTVEVPASTIHISCSGLKSTMRGHSFPRSPGGSMKSGSRASSATLSPSPDRRLPSSRTSTPWRSTTSTRAEVI